MANSTMELFVNYFAIVVTYWKILIKTVHRYIMSEYVPISILFGRLTIRSQNLQMSNNCGGLMTEFWQN